MTDSILDTYSHFIFDVDRTIAPNDEKIPPSVMGRLRALIEHAHIVIVTSRGIHEGMELLAQTFFQSKSDYSLYFFTTSAAQAYLYDVNSGGLLKLYDKAKGDAHFQQFHQDYLESFSARSIELVDDVRYNQDPTQRQVQVHDRSAQVTLFFSNTELRTEYESVLIDFGVRFTRHGRNSLHVLPSGVDKRLAIDYLSEDEVARFLVFADGFYHDIETGNHGNDLSFTEFPANLVTCINVGRHVPKLGSGVFYDSKAAVHESEFTDSLLEKVLSGCSFEELGLHQ